MGPRSATCGKGNKISGPCRRGEPGFANREDKQSMIRLYVTTVNAYGNLLESKPCSFTALGPVIVNGFDSTKTAIGAQGRDVALCHGLL